MTPRFNKIRSWLTFALALTIFGGLLQSSVNAEAPQKSAVPTYREMVVAAIDKHILPHLDDFTKKARDLSGAVKQNCLASNPDAISKIDAAFAAAVESWAGVATDRIGPARKRDRATRISFWPDPRSIVRRQVRQMLAKHDDKLLQPGAIEKQSVAVQGLPALELLLKKDVGDETPEQKRFRCGLAANIAANISKQADDMKAGWLGPQGWRQTMLSPGADNPIYKTEADVAAEVLKSYLTALQIIRDNEVLPWLKAVEKSKKWARLPFEGSGLSQPYLANQIASLGELHRVLRLDDYAKQAAAKDKKKAWIVEWLTVAFKTMDKQAKLVKRPSEAAKDTSTGVKQKTKPLTQLKFYTNGLRQIVGRDIVPATGLFLGFNELDGD